MSRLKKTAYVAALILSVLYLSWRVCFTIPWHAHLGTLIFALALIISEIVSSFTGYILIAFRLLSSKDESKLVAPAIDAAEPLPAIDVIVVTHDEDVALLRKTVNAAKFMKYPDPSKVNVVISDDGNRPEVKTLADQYHAQYFGMSGNTEAKSGNVNHTLKQLHAPLFAIFDSDMIPFSTFLQETVPFFIENQKQRRTDNSVKPLGFIQTPQSFYNADVFQFNLFSEHVVPNEQDFFSRDVNVLNSVNDTAIFTGSNTVFLRSAVDEVGLFPTDTLTEDFELGARLNMAGYGSLSSLTPQASGITPIDIKGVIKQRTRWARGVMQSCRNLHILVNPKIKFTSRLVLLNGYLYWWSFLRRLIYIVAPILYALFKVQVVKADFWTLMVIWAPGYFLLQYVLGDTSGKIRSSRWGEIQETFFAPYLFLPVILETLGIHATKFKVTAKNVKASFQDKLYLLPYLFLWSLTLISIIKFNYGKFGSEIMYGSVITFWLLMHFINLSFCLFIASGRTVYRASERFDREIMGRIKVQQTWYDIKTHDISEGGFSFSFFPKNVTGLKQGDVTTVMLYHEGHPVPLKSTIMRTSQGPDGEMRYSVKAALVDANQQEGDHYLQLVYDGDNGLLPKEQDTWITPFDELYINVTQRLRNFERRFTRINRS